MSQEPLGPLVLVVDDDQDTRDMYAMYLSASGMRVLTASSAEAALTMAVEHVPDVVITDFMLGSSSGSDLCRRLREHDRTAHIRSLLLTGASRMADPDQAGACDGVRLKPYLPDALAEDIRSLVAGTARKRAST